MTVSDKRDEVRLGYYYCFDMSFRRRICRMDNSQALIHARCRDLCTTALIDRNT
jgi:hypothetical protein